MTSAVSQRPTSSALFDDRASPVDVLKRVWGYGSVLGKHADAIRHVRSGGDALVLFPMGKGKSLCFQIQRVCLPGTTIVISPLIALMRDLVEELKSLGVATKCLSDRRIERRYRPQKRSEMARKIVVFPPGTSDQNSERHGTSFSFLMRYSDRS